MPAKDLIDTLNAQMLSNLGQTNEGMEGNAELMRTLRSVLDRVAEEGLAPPEELAQMFAQLVELEEMEAAGNAMIKDGGDIAVAAYQNALAQSSMIPGGAYTPEPEIFEAIEVGDADRVRAALETWEVNARYGEFNKTALYAAVSDSGGAALGIAELLLDAGANPSLGLSDGNVLHGLGFGRFEPRETERLAAFVQRCVSLGADIEERTNHLQWTPLHTALNEWNVEASDALLRAGADPNARAGDDNAACTAGQSCLEMALAHRPTFALLLQYGADPKATNSSGRSILGQLESWLGKETDDAFIADLRACREMLIAASRPN